MLTISQLARRFDLSRSTLLYYDSIGLLSPSLRSGSNYRLYSADDVQRMERIDLYRRAGLPLKAVAKILDSGDSAATDLLGQRLEALNQEIRALRRQQQMVVDLLESEAALRETRTLDKEGWVAILRATGLSDDDMLRWHIEFERFTPQAHQDFLESLGLEDDEIERIRAMSREGETP
ncbi:MAG: MerR family transcriptional regulator [Acidobacteriota bacterium]